MLYDNLVDSAIVFSGNTPKLFEFLLKMLAKACPSESYFDSIAKK
jgi:hypothetical protein